VQVQAGTGANNQAVVVTAVQPQAANGEQVGVNFRQVLRKGAGDPQAADIGAVGIEVVGLAVPQFYGGNHIRHAVAQFVTYKQVDTGGIGTAATKGHVDVVVGNASTQVQAVFIKAAGALFGAGVQAEQGQSGSDGHCQGRCKGFGQ